MRRLIRRNESGQAVLEYLMVIGVIAVPIAAAFIALSEGLIPGIVGESCTSIDTAGDIPSSPGSCIETGP